MCVSAAPARFSQTIEFFAEVLHPIHGLVHVVGYQNNPVNLSPGANAMLLHIPNGAPMTSANFLDMGGCRNLLKIIVKLLQPREDGMRSFGATRGIAKGAVEVFDRDIYTIVRADDATDIPDALNRVPTNKRPTLGAELYAYYQSLGGHSYALCCFDNREAAIAAPIFFWYKPYQGGRMSLPAIDCHTGGAPDLRAQVAVDHWVILGSHRLRADQPAPRWLPSLNLKNTLKAQRGLTGISDELAAFLPDMVVGRPFEGLLPNGDFVIPESYLLGGQGEILRLPPEPIQ